MRRSDCAIASGSWRRNEKATAEKAPEESELGEQRQVDSEVRAHDPQRGRVMTEEEFDAAYEDLIRKLEDTSVPRWPTREEFRDFAHGAGIEISSALKFTSELLVGEAKDKPKDSG